MTRGARIETASLFCYNDFAFQYHTKKAEIDQKGWTMELLLLFVLVVSFIYYMKGRGDKRKSVNGANNKKSPSGYKRRVKALLKGEGSVEENCSRLLNTLLEMANEEGIQEFFHKTYGKMCDFTQDEVIFESYFLLVFGDQRNHYVYSRNLKTNRFEPAYDEHYEGNKNLNLIVTDKRLYIGDDLNQKKGQKPIVIPLDKIESVEQTSDYVEVIIKTPMAGERIHNIWNSSGNEPLFYLLRCLLKGREEENNSENFSPMEKEVL
jgi:hypothetical protein